MKKYLNKSIFFQGDAKIVTLLSVLIMIAWVALEFIINNSYNSEYRWRLYDYSSYSYTLLGASGILILGMFLVVSFIVICGLFKRKKWATLLSGPFSKIDIRKRELTLMIVSIVGFILMFLLVSIRYSIANDILVSYTKGYWTYVIIDIIRVIVIGLTITSILFVIDSLTSNMYITLGVLFAIGAYLITIMITAGSLFTWTYDGARREIQDFIFNILEGVLCGAKEYIYSYEFLIGIVLLVLITVICTVTTKKLIKKTKVEYMGEALVFKFTRKIAPFLLSTLIGMNAGIIIFENLLWQGSFDKLGVEVNSTTYPIIGIGIIIIISLIANIIIKCIIKALKNKIPKKYI